MFYKLGHNILFMILCVKSVNVWYWRAKLFWYFMTGLDYMWWSITSVMQVIVERRMKHITTQAQPEHSCDGCAYQWPLQLFLLPHLKVTHWHLSSVSCILSSLCFACSILLYHVVAQYASGNVLCIYNLYTKCKYVKNNYGNGRITAPSC